VYGFETITGKEVWKKDYGSLAGNIGTGNACIEGNRLFFRDENSIKCVDLTNGDLLWTVTFGNHYSGGISASDGWVACSSDRSMIVLDAKTGKERFQTQFPVGRGRKYGFSGEEGCPATLFGNPYIRDNSIYVFAGDGTLWVLNNAI
jgi:outer membrane protein assembly factor BamB